MKQEDSRVNSSITSLSRPRYRSYFQTQRLKNKREGKQSFRGMINKKNSLTLDYSKHPKTTSRKDKHRSSFSPTRNISGFRVSVNDSVSKVKQEGDQVSLNINEDSNCNLDLEYEDFIHCIAIQAKAIEMKIDNFCQ